MNTHFRLNSFVKTLTVAFVIVISLMLVLTSLSIGGQAVAAPAAVATPTGAQPLGPAGGIFNCGGWTVTVPANEVPTGGLIHCGSFNPDVAPVSPSGYTLLRHTININIYNNNGQWITNFNPPLELCFPYNSTELAATGYDLRNFNVLTAPINGTWSVLFSQADTQTGSVCGWTNHLTLFDLAISGAPIIPVVPYTTALPPNAIVVPNTVSVTFAYSYKINVQRGDTLFGLALRFNTSVLAIQIANDLVSNFIYVGEPLIIPTNVQFASGSAPVTVFSVSTRSPTTPVAPGPNTYVVQLGDNLFRLSLRFHTTVGALQAANGLTSFYIYVGQVLVIP